MFKPLAQSLLSLCVFTVLTASCSAKTNFDNVGREMVIILQNSHYAKLSFDDTMSQRILKDYIDFLDPQHLYFTASQVAGFKKTYGDELDNLIYKNGGTKPAQVIFSVFYERLKMRVDYTNELLDKKSFTFMSDAEVMSSREDALWPENDEEAKVLWARHAEEAVLSELLQRESIENRAKDLEKEADTYLDQKNDPYEKVKLRYSRILKSYDESDAEDVSNYFLSTVAKAYDPHSDYLSKREDDDFDSAIANSLVGIGALLSSEDDGATAIKGVVINGPADKQGQLKLNDRIVGVDTLSDGNMLDVMYMPISKVVSYIRGKERTSVTLKVEPAGGAPGETVLIKIPRGRVELKDEMASAKIYEIMPAEGDEKPIKLGWLKIPSFYRDFVNDTTSVARDVETLLKRMNKEEVDGLVIDMKGNGGGSLDDVQRITGFFVGAGPVLQVKSSLGKRIERNSYSKKALFTKPVVVHIDKTSASASEILAAALQDYNRAVVVGDESTFGKGTVQTKVDISRFLKWYQDASRAGAVKVTIQKFYRISGGSTQLKGVESDIVIPSISEALEIGERYGNHALEYDNIPKCNYEVMDADELFLEDLAKMSKVRLNSSQDFSYIKDDVFRTQARLQENKISLNIESRRKEILESELRRKERILEQTGRYAEMQVSDAKTFRTLRLNLDDVVLEELPVLDKNVDTYMKRAKEDLADLDNTPDFPSGLTPATREALSILKDLVDLSQPLVVEELQAAVLTPEEEAQSPAPAHE